MPRTLIALVVILGLAAFLASPASAQERGVQCSIQWARIASSPDIDVLTRFAGACAGTPVASKASARIARLRALKLIANREPKRPAQALTRSKTVRSTSTQDQIAAQAITRAEKARSAAQFGDMRRELLLACTNKSGQACSMLSTSYGTAAQGRVDYPLVVKYAADGCDLKWARACDNSRVYKSMLSYGPIDPKSAMTYFDLAIKYDEKLTPTCTTGLTQTCVMLGNYYLENARVGNERKMYLLWKGACEAGHAPACSGAGWAIDGRLPKWLSGNANEVRLLYEKACNGKYADGCYNYSSDLAKTTNGPLNLALSKTKNAEACTYGSKPACDRQKTWLVN